MVSALFLLATAYRTIYGVAGSYIAARLAPDRPMAHALALGVVGLAASIAGAVVTWGKGPEFGPAWYPLAVPSRCPCAWAVGGLRRMQLRAQTPNLRRRNVDARNDSSRRHRKHEESATGQEQARDNTASA